MTIGHRITITKQTLYDNKLRKYFIQTENFITFSNKTNVSSVVVTNKVILKFLVKGCFYKSEIRTSYHFLNNTEFSCYNSIMILFSAIKYVFSN